MHLYSPGCPFCNLYFQLASQSFATYSQSSDKKNMFLIYSHMLFLSSMCPMILVFISYIYLYLGCYPNLVGDMQTSAFKFDTELVTLPFTVVSNFFHSSKKILIAPSRMAYNMQNTYMKIHILQSAASNPMCSITMSISSITFPLPTFKKETQINAEK